jgi:hypothetical protein
MPKKRRISKSIDQRLKECETHIYFLWDALRLYPKERDRFKQIATELRVLVCETRHNKPLLLDLMDYYEFTHYVQPPGLNSNGPPIKPQPIPKVGWRDNPVQQAITEELTNAIESGDSAKVKEIEDKLAKLAHPVPFREWVNKGLAVYIKPYDYSYRELTLAIAQQFGSSHEDDSVEEPIVRLQQIFIGGESSDIVPLIELARYVLKVGTRFIRFLVENHSYNPKYFRDFAA